MRQPEAARAADLAKAGGGFITTSDLTAAGIDEDLARREVAAGRWQRPARRIYVPDTEPLDDVLLARIAVAYAGPRAVITGLIAARALRMRWVPTRPGAQVLVAPEVRRRSVANIRVRRSAGLDALDTWTWHDMSVAPAARVVLDCGLVLPTLREVRGVVLGAVADKQTNPVELRELLSTEPRNGTALLRRATADALRGAASPPEAELADELHGCGQPFLLNPEMYVDGTFVGCLDGYFPGLGAGWEVDSRERHEGDASFDATLARHTVFGGHGIVLAHPTPRQIRADRPAVAAGVLAVATARLRLPPHAREPRGLRIVPRGPLVH